MSLIIKLDENADEIMKKHINKANNNKYVWYCYFGSRPGKPTTKPYDHKEIVNKEVFFIGQGKLYRADLLDIKRGPNKGGERLKNKNEKDHMAYPANFDEQEQNKISYFLRCTNIKELNYDEAITNIRYYKNNKPYILERAPNPVSYVRFDGKVTDFLLR